MTSRTLALLGRFVFASSDFFSCSLCSWRIASGCLSGNKRAMKMMISRMKYIVVIREVFVGSMMVVDVKVAMDGGEKDCWNREGDRIGGGWGCRGCCEGGKKDCWNREEV